MTRRLAIRNIAVAGAVSLYFCPLLGSPRDDRPGEDYVFHSEVRLVLLDVSVKDRAGSFVKGLSKEAFDVFENNVSQNITVFANNDLPVTVGILVDESGSMAPKRADVLAAAETFIQESNSRDEIFVLNFNDTVKRGLPNQTLFSDNIKQLRSALYRGIPGGKTALNDAVVDGLKQLELGTRGRKALIVISDGGDNASQYKRQEMLDKIEGSVATVYTIGLFDANDSDRNPGVLNRLAKISGGQAYFPESSSRMASVCRDIAEDIRARYTIGYLPQERKGTGSQRHIRISARIPGHAKLTARARTSYRYDELTYPSNK